ncbi:peptide deformylase [Paraglaciecola sp. 2405UD69-4]|uniref:peptide deformylase n=1 Tax=Paraglaciecola sp. 2405UD69-4 TaxID=3391836 RepID=UPI0039C93F24
MKIAQVGEAILKSPARSVAIDEFTTDNFNHFCDALLTTMLDAEGIGIAAPQVFDPRAIMIIASRANARYPDAPDMQPMFLINPQIIANSDNQVWEWEGCLSVPGLRGRIERPDWVEVKYQDRQGLQKQVKFEGFVARIFLHEFDHLIGKTWLDHINSTDNIMANDLWIETFT